MIPGCPLPPLVFTIALEILARAIREEKEIKGIQTAKGEAKWRVVANEYIIYKWHPTSSAQWQCRKLHYKTQ